MQAIREIKRPKNKKITITLPESFGDEDVEVFRLSFNQFIEYLPKDH